MTRRYLLVINPAAGRHGLALAESVLALMLARGAVVDVYRTTGPADATRYLQSLSALPDVVIAAGGDGTVNEVINGIGERQVVLGLIPGGTTNVLATELSYPSSAAAIADVLLAAREQAVYFSQVNGRRFSMMTGIGYDAWVVAGVDPAFKKKVGKLAYVLSMLRQLLVFGRLRYRAVLDGVAHEAMSIVITKGRHYAGSYTLTHQADMTKPSLQVVLVQTTSRVKFLGMLLMLPIGLVEKLPFIRSVPARAIRVEIDGGKHTGNGADAVDDPVQADGDTVSRMPAEIRVESRASRVIVP